MPKRTAPLPLETERALVAQARTGDRRASSQLLQALQPAARDLLRRFVGQPDDVDDLTQDALLAAFEALPAHPEGQGFAAVVDAEAVKLLLAFFAEERRRWRPGAQLHLEQACADAEENLDDVQEALAEEGFSYDVREHVAFCFTAVSRSLPLEQQTAVLLVDVLGFDLERAAAVTTTEPDQVRRFLEAGRTALLDLYERMCRLAVDDAVCDQCRGLRDASPEGRKGPIIGDNGFTLAQVTPQARMSKRLEVVREADLDAGTSRPLHDLLYRMLARLEANRTTPVAKDPELPTTRARWEALQSRNN